MKIYFNYIIDMEETKRLAKNKQISLTKQETADRRANQICKTFTVKIQQNQLSKLQKEELKMIFVEAKWFYNDILNWSKDENNKIWNYNTKTKKVVKKDEDGNNVSVNLKYLKSSMKQSLLKRMCSNIKVLSTLKKRGFKIGVLKFKKEINCIELKQNGVTHRIVSKNRMKIQGVSGHILVNGLKQLKPTMEIANAKLLNKPDGYYISITTFSNKEDVEIKEKNREAIGIDFGCSIRKNPVPLATSPP